MSSTTVANQVANAQTFKASEISFNTNFNLADGAKLEAHNHQAAELQGLNAARLLREKFPGISDSDIKHIQERINHAARAEPGSPGRSLSKEELERILREAQKIAAQIALTQANKQVQAEAQAEIQKASLAIPLDEKLGLDDMQKNRQENRQKISAAQSWISEAQLALQEQMAYNDISIDAFFNKKPLHS